MAMRASKESIKAIKGLPVDESEIPKGWWHKKIDGRGWERIGEREEEKAEEGGWGMRIGGGDIGGGGEG